MKKTTLLIIASSIFVTLLFLSLAPFAHIPTIASKDKPSQDSDPLLLVPGSTNTMCASASSSMTADAILIGLMPGVTLQADDSGVHSNDTSLKNALATIGAQTVAPVFPNATNLNQVYRIRLTADVDVMCAVASLDAHPAVAYAEPDYLAHTTGTVPNDTLYPDQWGLAQINAPEAWDLVTGATNIVIAVIDAGLDTNHPDLSGQLWVNPGEIAGNGVDDDNNGHIDDIHGWNFVDDNADLSDNTGHGTQVAGIIAAATDNNQGVAGVCWNCRLMVVKVVQPGGVANYSDIAAGVVYAAQKGVKVINVSLGGYSDSVTLRAAIEAAAQTAVIVSGAGNDNDNRPFYPAAYNHHVLAVAGTTAADVKTGSSNYGTWIDVSAPAEAIVTTLDGGSYGNASGTSIAAPFVAGVAGLLRSQYPHWSVNGVRAQIVHTAQNIDAINPGYTEQLGSGRIDAGRAVTATAQPLLTYLSYAVDGEMNGRPEPGSTVDLVVTLQNDWADATNVQATLGTTDSYVTITSAAAFYGDIPAYESRSNVTPFRFSVNSSAPYGHGMVLSLAVTANGGYTAIIPLTIPTSPGITYVHGTLTSQTWDNDRTYIIDGEAGIAVGHVLTIAAGTTIRFDSGYSLSIAGTLIADGTPQQPIRFTANKAQPAPGDWGQIKFLNSCQDATFDSEGDYVSGSIIRHTVIEYGEGINLSSAAPYVANNTFQHISGSGISGSGSAGMVIANNTFTGAGISLTIFDGIFSVIGNSISKAGITVNGPGRLERNVVSNPSDTGIAANLALTITANRATGCWTGMMVNGGYVSGNLLANNTNYGLRINGAMPSVISNTVAFNGKAGIYIENGTPAIHQNNLIASIGQYALHNAAAADIDATNNWWGSTNTTNIQAAIYDGNDEFGRGMVDYGGYLALPVQDAPAYVRDVTISPDTTLGIETGVFDVRFSRPMNKEPNLTFWTTRRDTWQRFNASNSGLTDNSARDILIDKNGDKWFSTWDGLSVWRTDGDWQKVFANGAIYALTPGVNGDTIWVATNGMGTYVFSLNGTLLQRYPIPNQVMDVHIDNQGNAWIAGWGQGLYLLRADGTWQQYTSSNSGLATDMTYTVIRDREGSVWCGFGDHSEGGVSRLRPDGTWETYTKWNSSLASNTVRTIVEDEAGDIWFGTSSGLNRLRPDGTWSTYPAKDGYAIAFINDEVWVGEYRSVAILRDGMIVRIPGVDPGVAGLPYDTVHDIVPDAEGNIWFATCCSNTPPGGAAVLWRGNDYKIEDGAWVADNIWRASYDITALIPRETYTLSVRSAVDIDGIEIAPDTRSTFTVDYAGQITDKTPPPPPSVTTRGIQSDPSHVSASWFASDPESAIISYRYAIGSSPGAADIINWTTTSNTSVTLNGLGLTEGHAYWFSVRAQNVGGLWSTSGYSIFFAGPPPHSVFLPLVLKNR